MLISELLKKNLLIWGYGLEGKSILNLLIKKDPEKKIYIATKDQINENINNVIFINENDILNYNFEVVVKSSGISFYRDEINQLLKKNCVITSILNVMLAEMELYKNNSGSKFPKVIAITGTKGKSTTSSMLNHILKNLNYKTILLGNIGISFLDVLNDFDKYDYIVLELSSYQCKIINYPVDYGIVLNLYPEHIDWHLNHDNYYNDKMNLLKFSKKSITNYENMEVINRLKDKKHYLFFNTISNIHLKDGKIYDMTSEIYNADLLDNIRGIHIFKNLCGILTFLKSENINMLDSLKTLKAFKTLEHRLEIFYDDKNKGISFINDSISTIPEATIEALHTFNKKDNILLVLGGFDRKQNYSELIFEIIKNKKIKKIFLLGQTGQKLLILLKENNINCEFFNTLEELVNSIKSNNLNNTDIIFSPASPSLDMFKNFEDRGKQFKNLVL